MKSKHVVTFFFFLTRDLTCRDTNQICHFREITRKEVSQCFPHWCRIGSTSCPLLWCLAFLIQKHWILQTLEDQILYSFEVSSSLQFCPTLCLIYQNKSCILSFPIQVPRKTNDRDKIYEYIFNFNRTLSLSPHIISSNMDMKMILSMKCSNSHCILFMNFWISSRMSIVVNPQKIFHSNSVCMSSIRFNSLKWLFCEYHLILFIQAAFWITSHLVHAKCWVAEDTDFDSRTW